MHIFIALLLSICILPDGSVLTTVSGQNLSGTLESVSRNSIQFKTVNGLESFDLEQITSVVLADAQLNPEPVSLAVTLVDDSVIHATSFSSSAGKSQVATSEQIALEIDNRDVHCVLLKPPADAAGQSQWTRIRQETLESGDALVVQRKGGLEAIEGIVGDVSADKVEFKLDQRTASIDRSKITGIIYYHALGREIPASKCQLTLRNGTSLRLRELQLVGDSYSALTGSGVRFELPRDTVARLDFSLGRAVFMGSMTPANRDWTPLIAGSAILEKLKQVRLPRANRSFDNRPLELTFFTDSNGVVTTPHTQSFDNGYAMVGGSKLVFSLDRQFERLTGLAGFAPTADSSGNVALKIRCDSQLVLQQQLRKSDNKNPLQLDIDVKDVQRLVIEVDYQDGRSIGDLIHLCDLKVSR